jgi:hypothetical protein
MIAADVYLLWLQLMVAAVVLSKLMLVMILADDLS